MPKKKSSPPHIPERFHFDRRARAIADALADQPPDTIVFERDMIELDGCSAVWHSKARAGGYGPPWIRIGRRGVEYRLGDVRAWFLERALKHGDEVMSDLKKRTPQFLKTKNGSWLRHDQVKLFTGGGEDRNVTAVTLDGQRMAARDMAEVLYPELIGEK